jgi:hypothetical protein
MRFIAQFCAKARAEKKRRTESLLFSPAQKNAKKFRPSENIVHEPLPVKWQKAATTTTTNIDHYRPPILRSS